MKPLSFLDVKLGKHVPRTHDPFKLANIDLMEQQRFEAAITFNFYLPSLKPIGAHLMMSRFLRDLDRRYLGRNFTNDPAKRTFVIAHAQHASGNAGFLHFHGGLTRPQSYREIDLSEFKEAAQSRWRERVESGQLHIEWKYEMKEGSLSRWHDYATREATRFRADHVFISSAFHSN
jgi:hypothetical protein